MVETWNNHDRTVGTSDGEIEEPRCWNSGTSNGGTVEHRWWNSRKNRGTLDYLRVE